MLVFPLSLFRFKGVSSSSGCLRKATLFYCDTPWAFHITILEKSQKKEKVKKLVRIKVGGRFHDCNNITPRTSLMPFLTEIILSISLCSSEFSHLDF